jgi:O-antigen/teichoic acid export membrane protein
MSIKGFKIYKDILWYLFGTAIPIIISFIKTPIFTRYFTPEEYGNIGLISITFGYILIIVFAWVTNCLWRFYNKYKNNDKLNELYSNVLFMYVISSIFTIAICLIWVIFFSNSANKNLILLNLVQTVLTECIALYMIIVRLQGKAAIYNVFNVSLNISSFLLLVFLTFGIGHRIEATIESNIIVNLILFILIFVKHRRIKGISYKFIRFNTMKKFFKYGLTISLGDLSLLLLTSSDRYIIRIFDSIESVGIYNQIYNLAQMSIATLIAVFFNAVNPILFRELECNIDNYDKTMNTYITIFILMLVPITTYFSLFSKQISIILLGESFRVGYRMMSFIMFTSLIYGMALFIENKLNFSNKMKVTVKGLVIASILNISLNFIFIPLFNYQLAAVTTLTAYIFLYLYYYFHDSNRYFNSIKNIKVLFKPMAVIVIQVILDFTLRYICKIEIGVIVTILEGTIFLIIYLVFLGKQGLINFKFKNGVKEE